MSSIQDNIQISESDICINSQMSVSPFKAVIQSGHLFGRVPTRDEPMPPALGARSLNHRTAREVPKAVILVGSTVIF